ncbi:RNA polymerase sigma factor SigB [compost metagenome]
MLYQRYQAAGLDRGSDGQIAAVCKRLDSWFSFNALNEIERKVVFLHYLQGKSQEEVGKLIGRTRQTVARYAREALEKMEAYINNWPEEKVA